MPQQQEQQTSQERQDSPQSATICAYVLRALGRPINLYSVQVRRLWEDHYRVNVLVGPNATDIKVAHSYFLVTDGDGNLDSSDPAIVRQYAPDVAARIPT